MTTARSAPPPAGDVSSTTTYNAYDAIVTDTYQYDALNRLTSIAHEGVIVDQRLYDAASRVVQRGTGTSVTNQYMDKLDTGDTTQPSGLSHTTDRFVYDAAGQVLRERDYVTQYQNATFLKGTPELYDFHRFKGTDTAYDQVGNVTQFSFEQRWDFTNAYTYSAYQRFDDYQAGTIFGTSTVLDSRNTDNRYDANGHLIGYTNAGKVRSLVNDASGLALYASQEGQAQRQVIVNGEVLGRYGVGDDKKVADFNFSYQSATSARAATTALYTVRAGEDLRSIARNVYGDESLWYRIADANNLSGVKSVLPGQQLSLPAESATIHNGLDTLKPYDSSKITGDITPNLPAPGPACGGQGQVIVQVVAIVVAIIVTAILENPEAGHEVYNAIVVIGAAAAGTLAGQVTAVAIGLQKDINWKSVAVSAIGAAVTAGLPISGAPASAFVQGAVNNALTQGISIAFGLQEKFDWRGVAAAGAGAAVGQIVDQELGAKGADGLALKDAANWTGLHKFAEAGLRGFASGLVTSAVQGGRVSLTQVSVDAFGVAVGEAVANSQRAEALRRDQFALVPQSSNGSGLRVGAYAGASLGVGDVDNALGSSIADAMRPSDAFHQIVSALDKASSSSAAAIANAQETTPARAAMDDLAEKYGGLDKIPAFEIRRAALPTLQSLSNIDVLPSELVPRQTAGLAEAWDTITDQYSFAQQRKNIVIGAGVVAGLFQGVGDNVIGLGKMASDALLAHQYITLGGDVGFGGYVPGGREAFGNVLALGDAVARIAKDPSFYLGEAVGHTVDSVNRAFDTATETDKLPDWFFYGAAMGRATFDVASLALGAAGLARGLTGLGVRLAEFAASREAAAAAAVEKTAGAGEVSALLRTRINALAPEVRGSPFLADQALSTGSPVRVFNKLKSASEINLAEGNLKFTDGMTDRNFTRLIKSVRENGFENKVIQYVEIEGVHYIAVGNNRVMAAERLGKMDQLQFQKVDFPVPNTQWYSPTDIIKASGTVRPPKVR